MEFKTYPKIHRIGKEEVEGILVGECVIQEKIDGANVSIWFDGKLRFGSRSQEITERDDSFNGFKEFVLSDKMVEKFFKDHPKYRIYGEWLVPHTVHYNETSYRKMYVFDIQSEYEELTVRLPQTHVKKLCEEYGFNYPEVFATVKNPTLKFIHSFVGKTTLGEKGEGVVIKNMDFVNAFGDRQYAKLVSQEFLEENSMVFGGNNKYSDTYYEMWVVNKYMTLERVRKVMQKIQPLVEHRLDMEDTARIINTAYHDLIMEEIWTISKKCPIVRFKVLSQLCCRKAAKIYHDILNNFNSVAYETSHNEGPAREREVHPSKENDLGGEIQEGEQGSSKGNA